MSVLRSSVVVLAAAVLAHSAAAQTTITNTPTLVPPAGVTGWRWGVPTPGTIGQTVVVPTTDNILQGFSYWMSASDNGADLRFTAHVVQWDPVNQVAIGPVLFTSSPLAGTASTGWGRYDFTTGGVPLPSGTMYALLLSTAGVDQAGTGTAQFNLLARGIGVSDYTDTYGPGGLVQKPRTGDFMTALPPWDTHPGDLAFEARFASAVDPTPPPSVVPEPSTVVLLGSGLAALALGVRRRRVA